MRPAVSRSLEHDLFIVWRVLSLLAIIIITVIIIVVVASSFSMRNTPATCDVARHVDDNR